MARPIWTGATSFGLVNVAVKCFTATESHAVRFHQLRAPDVDGPVPDDRGRARRRTARFAEDHHLGPDAASLDRRLLDELCDGARGNVKRLLTDQARLAGIGNVYADEVLYRARMHPETPASDLDDADRTRLLRGVHHVLRVAVERGADPERVPRSWLLPRREDGARCPRCGGTVERHTVGGRATYLCPACQPAP